MKSPAVLLLALALTSAAIAQTSTAAKPTTTPTAPKKPATSASTAKKPTSSAPAAKKSATAGTSATTLKDKKDKFSYALGLSLGTNLGNNLRKQQVEFDPSIVAQGMQDALANNKHLLTDQEAEAVLKQVGTEVRAKEAATLKAMDEKNKADGAAFLASNKSKPDVVTLPSGLQYKVITAGTGPKPTANDTVACNYRGTLLDGKEFDSSAKHNGPATFPVNGVIKGWTEALQLMPVGSKWQLFVPSDLAYGDRGAGEDIAPGSTLIFEVELLSIDSKLKDANPYKK
jgi:FKBP-type peptidyl-prolyl cis-trans isomerase FklB